MEKSKVAVIHCPTYEAQAVFEAIQRGVNLLGGVERVVTPGERILMKANILAGDPAEKAVTTHPAVLEGAIRLFRQGGAQVIFGDSPGLENGHHAAKACGLLEAGERAGAAWGDFSNGGMRSCPQGKIAGSIPIGKAVHECDGIVNLPKMKTHQLTRITGAVKNLFGCVPGKRKALYHVQFQDVKDFSTFLVELALCLKPRLHILDGIHAMEGNGPRSGDVFPMGVLVLSEDPVAVDATYARLVNLDPEYVPTIPIGRTLGLGVYRDYEIDYVGDALADLIRPEFKVVRKPVFKNASYAYYNFLKNLTLPRPTILSEKCVKCGMCVAACPVPDKAVRFDHGKEKTPVYHYNDCIRCYCCLEMCPNRAIIKHTPLLGHLLRVE